MPPGRTAMSGKCTRWWRTCSLKARLMSSGNTPGGPPSTSATLGVVVMIELSAPAFCSWWIWLKPWPSRGAEAGRLRAGWPSSEKLATPSRGTPMVSSMTPRPQVMWAGTTSRWMCQSLSRSVAGVAVGHHERVQVGVGPAVGRRHPGGDGDVHLVVDHGHLPAGGGEHAADVLGADRLRGHSADQGVDVHGRPAERRGHPAHGERSLGHARLVQGALEVAAGEPERGRLGVQHDGDGPGARRGGEAAVE